MLQTSPSTVIGGRYELQRELARGGMGSVWIAKDRKLRRSVAIKVMVPMWAESADATARFEREAMAVAQLQSPHVVQIFDYGVEEGCPYIVMELLEGEDLRQKLQRQERLDLETAGKVLVQTAKALSAAHAAGIIHRDLKPGNIFLAKSRDDEIVKVLDFGVAKFDQDATGAPKDAGEAREEKTKVGTLLGTPQYMSPEQARGLANIDQRADLWSLGVIIYRALVGKLPFTGKSAADVIVKICTQQPPRPTLLAPDLPPEVDRFFKRAFSPQIDQRFESARQMAIAFSRIAPTSFPSLSMPDPMPEIAQAMQERQKADTSMDWDDDASPTAGPTVAEGASGGRTAREPGGVHATDGRGAELAHAPDAAGGSDVFGTPPDASDGPRTSRSRSVPLAPGSDPLSGSVPSGTLPSGLVDATPAATSKQTRRTTAIWGIAIGALLLGIVAVVLLGGMLRRGAGDSAAAGSPAAAASGGELARSAPQPSAALSGADSANADAPTGTAGADLPPIEELPPDRITPGHAGSRGTSRGKATATATARATAPPPPPPTTPPPGGDPFSERL